MFEAGERAAKAGDNLRALLFYAQAAKLDPANMTYTQRKAALQASALAQAAQLGLDPRGAGEPPAGGAASDPEKAAQPAPTLLPAPGRRSFDLKAPAQTLFEQVAGAFGIQVIFDAEYVLPPSPVTFRITDAAGPEALRALETATDSFLAPLSSRLAMVARDTAQKRTEFTPVILVAVPIPERLTIQEAQEISTAVQQTLEIKRITLDPGKRLVFFRDVQPNAQAARLMFTALSRTLAQVEIGVEFISVGRTSTLSYGLSLPTSASIVDFGKTLGNMVKQPGTYYAFGGGASLLGLGIANAAAFATLSKTSAETLLRAEIVALDGQAASLLVGNRYPVITGNFTGITGGLAQNPGLSSAIRFEDLGLSLKITPVVHDDSEVTLDVDAQFKTLGNHSANGIPEIASRQYQGKVRLKEGEWGVIAGLVSATDSETPTGIAGLSSLPGIGKLFTHQIHEKDLSETLIVLKPRLVASPPWETVTRPLWTGTESRPLTPF